MDPIFFETPAAFRAWLAEHHATADFLWVGFHRKGSQRDGITWPESVDEALCFGWIDGVRKTIDAQSYMIRFTRRKSGSVWSNVNVSRVQALDELGRMRPEGLAAFQARKEARSGIYSHEQKDVDLPEPYQGLLRENAAAFGFLERQAPSYRKAALWWVAGAKKEETRRRRFDSLIEHSAWGEKLPHLLWKKASD
ncbi:YdeI/OmpD-associated family protein [Paludisphaera rhizosphaerae]|uniref:YdeI/OmpD-associated family protein n=1 Tax=Paludisphaera rhizosphaerae TaxID=2711216 RepID=UPI0013ED8EEE|nr:YdeI/OmpD-associated family protein [Paludisphaera rhizosphaerae]